jgi:hypothetical protein
MKYTELYQKCQEILPNYIKAEVSTLRRRITMNDEFPTKDAYGTFLFELLYSRTAIKTV